MDREAVINPEDLEMALETIISDVDPNEFSQLPDPEASYVLILMQLLNNDSDEELPLPPFITASFIIRLALKLNDLTRRVEALEFARRIGF